MAQKNKAMRLASGLLVATLLSTSVISGTFAKYVTTDSASDSATVAKWGVVISTSGSLYGDAYGADSTAVTYSSTDSAQTVRATADGTKIVAPGTKSNGTGLKFTVNGTPEVKTQIDATIKYQNIYLKAGDWGVMVKDTTITAENYTKDADLYYSTDDTTYTQVGTEAYSSTVTYYRLHDAVTASPAYYPVVYAGASVSGKTTAEDSLKAVCEDIRDSLNGETGTAFSEDAGVWSTTVSAKQYAANTNLSTAFAKLNTAALSWEWAYEGTGDDAAKKAVDGKDTILGNLVNGLTLTNAAVVYRASSSASYANTSTDATGVVKDSSSNEIGGTKTSFSIEVTATQVDN